MTERQYYLSACAIHRSEGQHLREWIEYHRLVGFEHFLLLDNNSPPDPLTDEVLQPYVQAGIVECTPFPGSCAQYPAYAVGFDRIRHRTKWLAFIDIDEFVYPVGDEDIPAILRRYEDFGGLAANWCCFGSSGLISRPPSLIAAIVDRGPDDFPPNQHVKTIIRTDRVTGPPGNAHYCDYLPPWFAVNEAGQRVDGPFNSPPTHKVIRINHYIVGSQEDFANKASRGRVDCLDNGYNQDYWDGFNRNDVRDEAMARRFGSRVLERLQLVACHCA